ncbi:Ig-like domain-containing protein, partial [Candidatus Kaiserbacteria bacterium]|nr:Ig-like domain-containing protein [Candidatus Kaiserbacteria bacterium]
MKRLPSVLKKLGMFSAALMLFTVAGAQAAFASTVTRSFDFATPAPGEVITVTLAVDVTPPDAFYVIDEVLPAGWTVTVPGTGDTAQAGHIKWAVLSGAVSTALQYQVEVPPTATGVNSFSGEFAFDSNPAPLPVLGETDVTVTDPAPATTPVLTFVDITPVTAAITVGETLQLTATEIDQNGNVFSDPTIEIIWMSDDPAVADVDQEGFVTGMSEGFATVIVTALSGTDIAIGIAEVTVTAAAPAPDPIPDPDPAPEPDPTPAPEPAPDPVPTQAPSATPALTSVVLSPVSASLAIGGTQSFTALPLNQNGLAFAGASVTWSSSDETVAAVDASGLVTGVAEGTATITASAADGAVAVTGTAAVTVSAPLPPASASTVTRSFASAFVNAGSPI